MAGWLQNKLATTAPSTSPHLGSLTDSVIAPASPSQELADLLPLECVQLIQDAYADLLGVMLIVTDMEGVAMTEPSHPCGLFSAISAQPGAIQKCIASWHELGTAIDLAPQFRRSHLGLLCARGLIRVGRELKGMVVAGCIAPSAWPPATPEVAQMAAEFAVEKELLTQRLHGVYHLDEGQKQQVLTFLPRVANIIAHIVDERKALVDRLTAIANLTRF